MRFLLREARAGLGAGGEVPSFRATGAFGAERPSALPMGRNGGARPCRVRQIRAMLPFASAASQGARRGLRQRAPASSPQPRLF